MRKDIIVTGGTGFIGSSLARKLVKKFNKDRMLFLAWDKDTQKESTGIKNLKKLGIKYRLVDLNKRASLGKLPSSPKIVIHLAASTDTLDNDHRVNLAGTKNLINSLDPNKNTFFVHISTVADMSGRKDLNRPFTEKDKPAPTNEYGRSKYLAEKYLTRQTKSKGFDLTILRLNTVYGPGENGNNIFRSIDKMVNNDNPIIKLNWPGKITVIHKDDIVKSIIKIIQNKRKFKNKAYVLGTEDHTFSELIRPAFEHKNKQYNKIAIPDIVWMIISKISQSSHKLEGTLNYKIYNWLWRFNLISNSIFWADTSFWHQDLVDWKTKKYSQSLSEVYD